jgi:hypothetical protein
VPHPCRARYLPRAACRLEQRVPYDAGYLNVKRPPRSIRVALLGERKDGLEPLG